MKRNGVNRLPKEEAEKRRWQAFDAESEPGFLHLDVKYLTRLKGKRAYVYLAIDCATRYVFAKVCYDKKPATAKAFLQQVLADFPCPVRKVMTDNGFEFTDRCAGGVKSKPTGRHAFDVLCARHGIQHKLTGTFAARRPTAWWSVSTAALARRWRRKRR